MNNLFLLFSIIQLFPSALLRRTTYIIPANSNKESIHLELVKTNIVRSFIVITNSLNRWPEFYDWATNNDSEESRRNPEKVPRNMSPNRRIPSEEKRQFLGAKISTENGQVGLRQEIINTSIRKISDPRNKFKLTGAVKVRGGNDAPRGLFPWQVSIMRNNVHRCGGSLFATNPLATTFDTVLTAAHCVFDGDSKVFDPEVFTILGGTVLLDSIEKEEGGRHQTSKVCRVIPHPSYNSDDPAGHFLDDIAVLKISTPFRKCNEVDAIQVETSLTAANMSGSAYISGWGEVNGGNYTNRLQAAKVPIISDQMCGQLLFDLNRRFDGRTQICAGGLGEIDVCNGDSGGPLICKNSADEFAFLCGIVSYGARCSAPEEVRKVFPGVYTMPQRYSNWIKVQESLPRCL